MKRLSFVALAVLLAACSNSNLAGGTDVQPTPTEVGTPLGEPVNVDIGPSGGSLTSADGAVSLSVPAGAVTSNATFGIQEITNFAPGRIGRAYRLNPDGTAFARPVIIQFKLEGSETGTSQPTDVSAAYQDSEGYWIVDSTESYDEASRTLTVTTAHFSDWSPVAGAQINPLTATVKVGQTVNLELQICDEAIEFPTPTGPKDQVFHCVTNAVLDHVARKWSVNGVAAGNASVGTITETSPGRVVYTAPAKKPSRNPVAVSVEFRGLEGKDVTLVANVTVVDDAGQWRGAITYAETGSRPWKPDSGFEGSGSEAFQQSRTYEVVGVKEVDGPSTTLVLQETSSAAYTNQGHMEKKVYEICQAFGPVILRHHFIYDVQEVMRGEVSRSLEARLYLDDGGSYSLSFNNQDLEMSGTRKVIDIYKDACAETVNDRSRTEPVKTYANTGAGIFVEGTISAKNKNLLQGAYQATGDGNTVPTNIRNEWNLSRDK